MNIVKGNILNLTSGPVYFGNMLFCILRFVTRRYSRCHLVATVFLYSHIDGTPYTLSILPVYNGHKNSLEDLD